MCCFVSCLFISCADALLLDKSHSRARSGQTCCGSVCGCFSLQQLLFELRVVGLTQTADFARAILLKDDSMSYMYLWQRLINPVTVYFPKMAIVPVRMTQLDPRLAHS